eukprot:TRINITY_DN28163_c0_g2_i2.p1 TRINITY_DN28163_c0_g2~~TRINITY_DN28163_c0_g2_i2.p1  ORF type:complete len:299 (+),score=70.39 TRINITY_DN28163_c0_g2_i2:62-958(+)
MAALLQAVRNGQQGELRALMAQGMDLNGMQQGTTPLHEAVRVMDKKMVQILCEEFNADEGMKDGQGNTALDLAKNQCKTSQGAMEIVGYLTIPRIKRRCKRKVTTTGKKSVVQAVSADCMLRTAAQSGDEEAVRAAIAAGANVDGRNEFGVTPLHLAVGANHGATVSLLVHEFGADVTMTKNWGDTPLHWACAEGHTQMARLLINEMKANPNLPNHTGSSPLHFAAYYGHFDTVRMLVEEVGADMDAVNNIRKTPFEMCQIEEPENAEVHLRRRDVATYLSLMPVSYTHLTLPTKRIV